MKIYNIKKYTKCRIICKYKLININNKENNEFKIKGLQ